MLQGIKRHMKKITKYARLILTIIEALAFCCSLLFSLIPHILNHRIFKSLYMSLILSKVLLLTSMGRVKTAKMYPKLLVLW